MTLVPHLDRLQTACSYRPKQQCYTLKLYCLVRGCPRNGEVHWYQCNVQSCSNYRGINTMEVWERAVKARLSREVLISEGVWLHAEKSLQI